jgi:hypothetical protein
MAHAEATLSGRGKGMTQNERFVVTASSAGTVFEWYDFYLYGSRWQPFIGARRSSRRAYPDSGGAASSRLLPPMPPASSCAPSALICLRPHRRSRRPQIHLPRHHPGHGRISTFAGRPPARLRRPLSASLAPMHPRCILRLLQGLALGGEYGGAATYVAEHAPSTAGAATAYDLDPDDRDARAVFLSLLAHLGLMPDRHWVRTAFKAWGWRLPFLLSVDPPRTSRSGSG